MDRKNNMNTKSLSQTARSTLLARIAHALTICARDTYEVGTENVLEPQILRSYNELVHRVTGAVVQHMLGTDGPTVESILEIIREFGARHNRFEEIDFVLNRALQQTD
jgi:CRP-like cAMP-binding protein